MKNSIIQVDRIKKAQLRYFDGNGTEIPEIEAYTIFIKKDDTYINLFDFVTDCNVYERLPYSNNTRDGEDYGTKIRLVCGKEEKGICYVLESGKMKELKNIESISLIDLYKIILESKDFYFDRKDIINAYPHLLSHREKKKILEKDDIMMNKLFEYFNEKELEKTYKK
ncbi:MAG: hypothetical protein IK137_02145 [Bacilli bacterium]|nr:hypothetical protein [Bacilli bacterium]